MTVNFDRFRNRFHMAPIFARRAFTALEALHLEEFDGHRKTDGKELIEEVLPIAIFARNFEVPERKVMCKYTAGSENSADGEIRLSGARVGLGGFEASYFLEVTSAAPKKEHLRREALANGAFVYAGANIARVGSRHNADSYIVSKPPAVHEADSDIAETVLLVRNAIELKLRKEYISPCILIIRVEPDRLLSLRQWCSIAEKSLVSEVSGKFAAVYIVHTDSAICMPIFP